MKKLFGYMSKVDERELSLEDAFVDYLNDNYFDGAVEVLDAETIRFESNNFLNTYTK